MISASKSENQFTHQPSKNAYLSRKIAAQTSNQEYYGKIKKPVMSSKAKSEIDRDDSTSFKKSVHTTMTSRVLNDHARQKEKNAKFFSTRIIGSENIHGSKSSKLL